MWRFGYDSSASFILSLALLSMLGTILVWQKNRTGKTIHVWFWAAFFGILLGCAGTFALSRITDVALKELGATETTGGAEAAAPGAESPGMPGGMPGMGGGMPGGMGGGMPGGMGRGPRPKRELTDLVRKITLLTGDIRISLSPEQAATLATALKDIEKPETMSDDEAKAKHEALLALLDDSQKAQLEAIGLPRGPRPGGGGGSSEPPAEDANPFGDEASSAALETLRQRLAGEKGAEK